ncbi:unnamed protein product, partial [marine sediment metagenome]
SMIETEVVFTLSYGVHGGLVDESDLSLEEVQIPTAKVNGEECWIIPCRMLDNIAQEETNAREQMKADYMCEPEDTHHERVDND